MISETDIKEAIKYLCKVCLLRFDTLTSKDRIRLLFEALNMRVLKLDDIDNESILKFLEKWNLEEMNKLKDVDLINLFQIYTNSLVFLMLTKYYHSESVLGIYRNIAKIMTERRTKTKQMEFHDERIKKKIKSLEKVASNQNMEEYANLREISFQ